MAKSRVEHHTLNGAPILGQRGKVVQKFGTVVGLPIGLEEKVRLDSTRNLNQVLADTIMLRDMYKKHHWQVAGHTPSTSFICCSTSTMKAGGTSRYHCGADSIAGRCRHRNRTRCG